MEQAGLLRCVKESDAQLIYVEYGAGKGGLSHFVSQRLSEKYKEEANQLSTQKDSKFVLIDRDARRNKKDRYMRGLGFGIERYLMDIADFDIAKYLNHVKTQTQDEKPVKFVGIAKHLCGGATDLTLTSIKNLQSEKALEGLAIATCCHHACDTLTYVNL